MSVDLATALRSSSSMVHSLLVVLLLLLMLLLMVLMVGVAGVLGLVAALAIAPMQVNPIRSFII